MQKDMLKFNKKLTVLAFAGTTALALIAVASPLHAQSTDVKTDPTVNDAIDDAEMTADEIETAAEDGADEAMDAVEEVADTSEVASDDDLADKIRERISAEPSLGSYALDVVDMEGRYLVTGMIDKSEDFDVLQQALSDVEGVDESMIDNDVVQN